jgi:FAD/FMN-containing dehydrogenase
MGESWTNWAGSVSCTPRRLVAPASEAELVEAVRAAARDGLAVRAAGAGHSFSPLCASDGVIVSMERLAGLVSAEPEAGEAVVRAGTRLADLGEPLRSHGLALAQMGDIDRQRLAGALATGTHGTGRTLGNLSTQVRGLRLVTAAGEVVDCAADREPELFHAARVSLGALGLVTEVRLACRPAYRLHERQWQAPFEEAVAALDRLVHGNRHFEFFWRPATDRCDMKALNPTELPADAPAPGPGERIGWSDRIFPSERNVKFVEMEFSLPAAEGPDCLRELRDLMRSRHPDVTWPVEYRTVAADDIPLSPAHRRPTVAISVHQGVELPFQAFFADCEALFRRYAGRPHWGKLHRHGAADLAPLYPEWERFAAVRRRWDPEGRFLNWHLRTLLEG